MEHLALEGDAAVLWVRHAALADGRAIEEVAAVELQPGR